MNNNTLFYEKIRICFFFFFRIERGNENGNHLKFGDTFAISPCDTSKVRKLYVFIVAQFLLEM